MRKRRATKKGIVALILVLGLAVFLRPSVCFSQNVASSLGNNFPGVLQKLKALNNTYPQEKIHLHLDKPYYAAGEDIWFKAYLINTLTSGPSTISGVLYAELIDQKGDVNQQLKLPVVAGASWGDFKLDPDLPAGSYRLRAYTNWMRNAGPDFFFDKTLKIGNRQTKNQSVKIATAKKTTLDVRFFAEGGNLVQSLPNKLGIKAVNAYGRGEDISGYIIDNDGFEVTWFTSAHLGMGNVMLNPDPGKTYLARVKHKDGPLQTVSLPMIQKEGYVLAASQTQDSILVRILISKSLLNRGKLKLVAINNGNVYSISSINGDRQIITASMVKKDLPSGILQLTLFAPTGLPVAERLIFLDNPGDRIDLKVSTAKRHYATKEETELELESTLRGKPVQGTFSVSVTSGAVEPDELNESNILTSLLLTADLAGYVEQPNYYFIAPNEQKRRDLDNLMLTQGWRRLSWKQVMGEVPVVRDYQPERSLTIDGRVTTRGGTPIANSKVSVFTTTNGIFGVDTLTNAQGRFSFHDLFFTDSAAFIVQVSAIAAGKNIQVRLDQHKGQQVGKNKNTGDITEDVNEAIAGYLQKAASHLGTQVNKGQGMVLKEVEIVGKKNLVKHSENLNGPGNADAVITAQQLKGCATLAQCLERYGVAGMYFKDGLPYLIRNQGQTMQIVLDGVNIDSAGFSRISIFNVHAVEVLKDISKTAIYGHRGANSGVLVITSKRAGDEDFEQKASPGVLGFSLKGYAVSRQFYVPGTIDKAPDHRTTVYWSPNVIPAEDGKIKLNYVNSDDRGTYRVVVEGMDMSGNLSRSVFNYEVK